jgi:uncharacterized membrane protein (UPF0182 family)
MDEAKWYLVIGPFAMFAAVSEKVRQHKNANLTKPKKLETFVVAINVILLLLLLYSQHWFRVLFLLHHHHPHPAGSFSFDPFLALLLPYLLLLLFLSQETKRN